MAKNNKNQKAVKEMTAEEAAKLFDGGNEHNMAEKEMELELEVEGTESDESLELEMDGEELEEEMEDIVKEKVKAEEKSNQEQKHKRGPKPGAKKEKEEAAEKTDGEKPAKKPAKELDLSNSNIVEREIKKGRLSAPQGRIEKTDEGYKILVSDGIIFPKDQNWKHEETVSIMHEGKYITTIKFDGLSEDGKFKAQHENGTEVSHQWVRVELHKPGRDKDVVELFSLNSAQQKLAQREKVKSEKAKSSKKPSEELEAAE
jgi:hypothetical protein